MKTMILRVDGMSCEHCSSAVEQAVTSINGVVSVGVSLDTKEVSVKCDEAVTAEAVKNAIEDQGYDVI